jgi:hypothetical protein
LDINIKELIPKSKPSNLELQGASSFKSNSKNTLEIEPFKDAVKTFSSRKDSSRKVIRVSIEEVVEVRENQEQSPVKSENSDHLSVAYSNKSKSENLSS